MTTGRARRASDGEVAAPSPGPAAARRDVGVVMITRDRPVAAARAVERLRALPERPAIVVVVNGGPVPDLPPGPDLEVVDAGTNLGARGRDVGVARCAEEVVAFCDDDSWWEPGSLARAAALLDAHPRLGLLHARVVVHPGARPDPFCDELARSPLVRGPGPGVPILGFMACAAVVRRLALLDAGGFASASVGGEEERVALDLADAGWDLRYVAELVAHHEPAPGRDPAARQRAVVRSALLTAWARLPLRLAVRTTAGAVRGIPTGPAVRGAAAALRDWPRARQHRRVVSPAVARERSVLLDAAGVRPA